MFCYTFCWSTLSEIINTPDSPPHCSAPPPRQQCRWWCEGRRGCRSPKWWWSLSLISTSPHDHLLPELLTHVPSHQAPHVHQPHHQQEWRHHDQVTIQGVVRYTDTAVFVISCVDVFPSILVSYTRKSNLLKISIDRHIHICIADSIKSKIKIIATLMETSLVTKCKFYLFSLTHLMIDLKYLHLVFDLMLHC